MGRPKKKKKRKRRDLVEVILERHKLRWFDLTLDDDTEFLEGSKNHILLRRIKRVSDVFGFRHDQVIYYIRCNVCGRVFEDTWLYVGPYFPTSRYCRVCYPKKRYEERANKARDRNFDRDDGTPRSLRETFALQGNSYRR